MADKPDSVERCAECRRDVKRTDGCAHVVCPQRKPQQWGNPWQGQGGFPGLLAEDRRRQ